MLIFLGILKKQHKELHPLMVQITTKIDVDNPSLYQYKEIRNLLKKTQRFMDQAQG